MSLVSFASHVAACGVGMAVFGVFGLWNPTPEASTFAPKRQGAPTRLHAAVEIGSPAIRPRTDFYVHRNIARCVSSNSILFGLLPKTLPLQGAGLSLRSRAATKEETFGLHPCGGLCRATTKSISI